MPELFKPETAAEVDRCKDVIGWSWVMVQERLGWSVMDTKRRRELKQEIPLADIQYLRAVAEAVAGVPLPEKARAGGYEAPSLRAIPDWTRPEPDRFDAPTLPQPTQVRAMLLDDIAAKLAVEYHEIAEMADINADELAGARFAIGKMAERLGVAAQVRGLIKVGATQKLVASDLNERWTPPVNQPRAPFETDATTF